VGSWYPTSRRFHHGQRHRCPRAYPCARRLWAFIYGVIEHAPAGSFGPNLLDLAQPDAFFKLLYFSLTTLTTTGFGDITSMTSQAPRW
jgi:hypothetical protein